MTIVNRNVKIFSLSLRLPRNIPYSFFGLSAWFFKKVLQKIQTYTKRIKMVLSVNVMHTGKILLLVKLILQADMQRNNPILTVKKVAHHNSINRKLSGSTFKWWPWFGEVHASSKDMKRWPWYWPWLAPITPAQVQIRRWPLCRTMHVLMVPA
jgi:hypothetical protein